MPRRVLENYCHGVDLNPFTNTYEKVLDLELVTEKWYSPDVVLKDCYSSDVKVVCSGNVIEITEYEKPIIYGGNSPNNSIGKRSGGSKDSTNINRAKMKLRRLINANCEEDNLFITLTFAKNIQDVSYAKDYFKKFMKRLNYLRKKETLPNVRYVYVIEFQKRGAIHFHCVFFGEKYIPHKELWSKWSKEGIFSKKDYVFVNRIDNVDNIGAYVVKYMNKELNDKRLEGHDLYGRSKGNLREPIIINKKEEVQALLMQYENKIKCYENTFYNDYRGKCTYSQINLKRQA